MGATKKYNTVTFNHKRVRLTHASQNEGPYNWLFFPGGPGADSSYLQSLSDLLHLPGNTWLVDLPGNGGNVVEADFNYDLWSDIFLHVVKEFDNPIIVGHSFGGMFPLLFSELENLLKGFVILNSAPTLWLEEAVSYAKQFQLPDLTAQMTEFTLHPNQETFKVALDACMPYYFPPQTLEQGRSLLSALPFQFPAAVWWQRKAIEMNFSAQWVPQKVPTLIVGTKYDCIVPFTLFKNDPRFKRDNIEHFYLEEAGHCGWIEEPKRFQDKFHEFARHLMLDV